MCTYLRRTLPLLITLAVPFSVAGAEPFDYFQNSWNVVGLKDYKFGTRVTPDNALLLPDGKVRIRYGHELKRLSREQTKTLRDGWLPVVLLTAVDGPVRYEFTFWATPLPNAADWKRAFDWPIDGEHYATWLAVKCTNTGASAAEAKLRIEQTGARVDSRPQRDPPLVAVPGREDDAEPQQPPQQPPKAALIVEAVPFSAPLQPGAAAEAAFCFPYAPEGVLRDAVVKEWESDWRTWLDRTEKYWRGLLAGGAHIEVPCEKTNQALLAAHVCQFIANDGGQVHGGEGFYDEFYIRDGAYQLMELQEAGFDDAAAKAIEFYLQSQRADGRFETQKNQFDANGQALWVLWQYYMITADRGFLERAYPQMRRACDWLMQARRQAAADSPFAGLLPNAVADGEYLWDGKHHIVGYDLWNLRGLLCTADAARILGKSDQAAELAAEAGQYRAAIDAACKRGGRDHFPPSWEGAGTFWGNTETLWPTVLLAAEDPRVAATVDYARHSLGGGFVEGTIRWMGFADAIHPYMSAYTTMTDLARGRHEQVVADYYWYLLHSSASHAFPEGIFYKRRFAWADTIPHVTGACNFAIMLRHMLVHEGAVKTASEEQAGSSDISRPPDAAGGLSGGNELHLLAAVPDWWLGEGKEILVERAPTHFGELSLRVHGERNGVRIEYAPPKRNPPAVTWLHLPASRPLLNPLPGVRLAKRGDQQTRWDFAGVVALYSKTAPPFEMPLKGLVDLPLETALPAARCVTLDLSSVANTDPAKAPFGVPTKNLVFKGLATGTQVVAGVPFSILDPAANDGRGLVVLHSDKAPPDRAGPRSVDIHVGKQGRRLFFLGNVSGWGGGGDAGAAPDAAVARYVIHYADGQTQKVPLITSRTIDDWCSTPSASEAHLGLKGEPWHLNVLGVELRPVKIDRISFEDTGTVSAPLLAAVTLEQ